MAKCCNPIPGDVIFGFLTVVDGIKIDRSDCPNAIQLRANYAYRILKSKWINKDEIDFIATISIKGIDSLGLMNKVTQIISPSRFLTHGELGGMWSIDNDNRAAQAWNYYHSDLGDTKWVYVFGDGHAANTRIIPGQDSALNYSLKNN